MQRGNMKRKSFQSYLEKRFNKEELAEIKEQAQLEFKTLQALQNEISRVVNDYMKENKIGFNELVRRLDASPTHVAKIQKGEANLTLASLAHISALLKNEPRLVFKKSK